MRPGVVEWRKNFRNARFPGRCEFIYSRRLSLLFPSSLVSASRRVLRRKENWWNAFIWQHHKARSRGTHDCLQQTKAIFSPAQRQLLLRHDEQKSSLAELLKCAECWNELQIDIIVVFSHHQKVTSPPASPIPNPGLNSLSDFNSARKNKKQTVRAPRQMTAVVLTWNFDYEKVLQ